MCCVGDDELAVMWEWRECGRLPPQEESRKSLGMPMDVGVVAVVCGGVCTLVVTATHSSLSVFHMSSLSLSPLFIFHFTFTQNFRHVFIFFFQIAENCVRLILLPEKKLPENLK